MYTSLRTTYARREAERKKANRARAEARKLEGKQTAQQHADAIMRAYEEAYDAAHGRPVPKLDYCGGWYVVAGKRLREADMIHKTRAMWAAVHARELGNDDE